jgi:hypothetical protein
LETFKTPILIITFNRMDCVVQLIDKLRLLKPTKIYFFSDGARVEKKPEKKLVNDIREFVLSSIDWDCDLVTRFNAKNEGCKYGVSNAISWFFSREELGIILEDDCIPNISFFHFCQELLLKYKHDKRILHIGGTNPLSHTEIDPDYYFSNFNRIWGWASWKRAWAHFDPEINDWPRLKEERVLEQYFDEKTVSHYSGILDDVYEKKIDTWDYQWFLNRLLNGLAIIPENNLVSNIGFNENATHTKNSNSKYSALETVEIDFPLIHPIKIIQNKKLDHEWEKELTKSSFLKKIIRFTNNIIR